MLSAKSIQRLYRPLRLKKLRALFRSHSSTSNLEHEIDITDAQRLSRDQVLEIYDWIAQLNAQQRGA